MTEAEKDLKKVDDNMVEVVDRVGKQLFDKTRTQALTTHTCICCGKPAIDFKDEKSATEWRITGLCQKCQDAVFGED
jgi:hypothetical protein